MYHVTVLSNFARAFNKYQRLYQKSAIPQSTYPDEFYVLPADALEIGITKASGLRDRLGVPGDTLLALEAVLPKERVRPNSRNGVGFIWPSPDLPVSGLFAIDPNGRLSARLSIEDTTARSFALHDDRFRPFASLRPRSLSFLPIANGCQAACPFCFSDASVSAEQKQARIDWENTEHWIQTAHQRGAERAVVTGGGEPTILRWSELIRLIRSCHTHFQKIVLITNGVKLAEVQPDSAGERLAELHDAGLSVLAISRHHHSEAVNARLMNLETRSGDLLRVHVQRKANLPGLRTRLICVLQRDGIESIADIEEYLGWAVSFGVEEVCFKELYVSTSHESVYHSQRSNDWSARNQVPLSLVHTWAESRGFPVSMRLPWGAPVYNGMISGCPVRVAAYTEPSLFWERSNGIARSWNVMSDGTCLASLEDRRSSIGPRSIRVMQ